MKKLLYIISITAICCGALAKEVGIENPPPPQQANIRPIIPDECWKPVYRNKYILHFEHEIHDADTFKVSILISDFKLTLNQQTIRVSNYDSCEVDKSRKAVEVTDEEIKIGLKARTYIQNVFFFYPIVFFTTDGKRDVYGRLLGNLYITDTNHPNLYVDLKDLIFLNNFDRSQLNAEQK